MRKDIKQAIAHKITVGGFSAKSIIIPAAALILCLHALIVVNTIRINRFGMQISQTMQNNFTYTQISKNFESGSDILSDKTRLFISTGDKTYLDGYFQEMEEMRQRDSAVGQTILNEKNTYAYEQIAAALEASQVRVQTECRAMRLCADGFGIDLSDYPMLASVELTAEETALTPTEKQNAAAMLLISTEYLQSKSETHSHINRAIQLVSDETSVSIRQQSAVLGRARTLQWIMTLTIIVVLNVMILLLFVKLLNPLERAVNEVQEGVALPTDRGLSEFRRLAVSYNELLHHRKMMESYLRKQSQTDALTNLPNRLAFQDYIAKLSWDKAHSSVTVFSLDVNGLKETNDTNGHAYGDELLRNCAACILSVFGDEPGKKCFRFGGDEFAAFWVDVPRSEINAVLAKFDEEQNARDVSISVGYAYANDLSQTTVEELFEQADKSMYAEKAKHHRKLEKAAAR